MLPYFAGSYRTYGAWVATLPGINHDAPFFQMLIVSSLFPVAFCKRKIQLTTRKYHYIYIFVTFDINVVKHYKCNI